jgi:hypothetical protein
MTVHLAHEVGEVAARSDAGEGRTARSDHAARPSPSTLTRLDLSRAQRGRGLQRP